MRQVALHPGATLPGRERLVAQLSRALEEGRGAALFAAPGYGKTAALEALVAGSALPALWVDLGTVGGDPLLFARRLLEEVAGLSTFRGWRPIPRLIDRPSARASAIAAVDLLIAEFGAGSEVGVLIVLDDFHLVDGAGDLAGVIDHLIRRMPGHWRLLIAGREEPASPEVAKLVQYGALAVIDEADLALTSEEAPGALADWERMRGWPAGVALFARSSADSRQVAESVEGYFRSNVLRALEPGLATFAIHSAALPFLEAGLCNRALQRTDAARMLSELTARHVFVQRDIACPDRLVVHPAFREFLLHELAVAVTATELMRLRQRCAAALAAAGFFPEAADQLIVAADWRGLATLLRQQAPALFHSGGGPAVLSILERIPPEVFDAWPWLYVHRARAHWKAGRGADPDGVLERAAHLFAASADPDGQASALLEQARLAEAGGEIMEAVRLCRRALGLVRDPQIKVEILTVLALESALAGDLGGSRQAGEAGLDLVPSLSPAHVVATDRLLLSARLALAAALAGDFYHALRRIADASQDLAGADETSRMVVHHLHGWTAAWAGEFELAFEQLDLAQGLAVQHGHRPLELRTLATRAELLATMGRLSEAEAEFRRAGWPSHNWADPGYFYLRNGQPQQAAEIYQSDIARASAAGDGAAQARARAMLGVCLVAMGAVTEGRRLLERAEEFHAAQGLHAMTPGIRLHLADRAFADGRIEAGTRLLELAIGAARAGGAYRFYAFDPQVTGRCLRRASDLGLEPDYVRCCQRRLESLAGWSEGPPEPDAPTLKLLAGCPDSRVRADLQRSLASGRLTSAGLARLLHDYGLTWRESQVFVRYYLPDAERDPTISSRQRSELAAQLGIAEHTVRHHVNSIRGKLGLAGQRGMAAYRWAVTQQITTA